MNFAKFYLIPHASAWSTIVPDLFAQAQNPKIWCLTGPLGAGKTTLVKAIAHHLQVIDQVHSPTFSIINSYATSQGDRVHHIDLYRLENPQELAPLAIQDYLSSGDYCFIEWAEKIIPHLTTPYLLLTITPIEEGRKLEVQCITP